MQQVKVGQQESGNKNFVLCVVAIIFAVMSVGGWITVLAVGPVYIQRMDDASQQKSLAKSQEAVTKASVVEYDLGQLSHKFDVYKDTHP